MSKPSHPDPKTTAKAIIRITSELVSVIASQQEASIESSHQSNLINGLKAELRRDSIIRSYQWALSNAKIGEFEYRDSSNGYRVEKGSSDVITSILLHFMRDVGFHLDPSHRCHGEHDPRKLQSAYRVNLVNQIKSLTGTTPRLEEQKDDRWVILPERL